MTSRMRSTTALMSSRTSTENTIIHTTAFSVRERGSIYMMTILKTAVQVSILNETSSLSAMVIPVRAAPRLFLILRGCFMFRKD